mgnify:FL=1
MWKNKSVFNNFHGVFNILGANNEKRTRICGFLRENLVEKPGESVENKPLVGKTC